PRPARSFPVRKRVRSDRFLEILRNAEGDLLGSLDLDRLTGRRVAAHACRTMTNLKNAKARDADLVALLQVLHDQADEIVEVAGRILLGHAGLLGQLGRDLGKRDGRSGGFSGSHSGGVPLVFRSANVYLTPQGNVDVLKVSHESPRRKPLKHEKSRF